MDERVAGGPPEEAADLWRLETAEEADLPGDDAPTLRVPRTEGFWDKSGSGARLVSRPIVVDELSQPVAKIELAPRIREVDGELVDDSYHAVDHAAVQFYNAFSLEQLAMATVALQIYMRRSKEYLQKKKELQERWTDLARRMKRARVSDSHLSFEEERLREKKAELSSRGDRSPALEALLALEEAELSQRREAWAFEKREVEQLWSELERLDEVLLRFAPQEVSTQDLRHPFVLTLLQPALGSNRKRSLGSAMNTLAAALQKPLSRTDQLLLEIALRRGIRACAPDGINVEAWERDLLRGAEALFVEEYPWARPYRSGWALK